MAFVFQWPRFSDQFHADARHMLETALNKGNKPPIIADRIEVVELEMGTQPPELEIRDIGDLTVDQFRGIFRLSYSGDAYIVLRTKVQANPLIHKKRDMNLLDSTRGMVAAQAPLVVPMNLRLSHFKLNSYVVLVVSKQKGITLVFKTDPLQNVDVNSTFDRIGVIQKYIQKEIEGQLREMFREDLPSIIHKLSQQWFSSEMAPKPKVEVPYARKFQHQQEQHETTSAPADSRQRSFVPPSPSFICTPRQPPLTGLRPPPPATASSSRSYPSTLSRSPAESEPTPSPAASSMPDGPSTFPGIEEYDPTYGLRPEELPAKSDYSGFAKLWTGPAGLGELAEEPEDSEEWAESVDLPQWDDLEGDGSYWEPSPAEPPVDYETVYAVGGGTVTRPRVYHSQSLLKTPSDTSTARSPGLITPLGVAARSISEREAFPSLRANSTGGASATALGLRMQTRTTPVSPMDFTPASIAGSSYFQGWDATRHSSHVGSSLRQSSGLSLSSTSLITLPIGIENGRRPIPPRLSMSSVLSHPPPIRSAPGSRRVSPPESTHLAPFSSRPTGYPSRSSSGLTYSGSTPPSSDVPPTEEDEPASPTSAKSLQARRSSISSKLRPHSPFDTLHLGSPPQSEYGSERGIVLKPAVNNTVSQLATLSHSQHTFSPYTRSMQHFAVRSGPPKTPALVAGGPPERPPPKARRRRTYKLGAAKENKDGPMDADRDIPLSSSSPRPASDYSEYFHASPSLNDNGARRRAPYASS